MCGWKRRMHKRQDGFGVLRCLNFLFLQLWTVRWFNDAINNALVISFLGEIYIWSGVNGTAEGRGSATLSEK